MASIVISGDTSGAVTLTAPAVSGTNTLTLPAQTATVATLTTPSFATTIGVGGATAAASGAGISFPATQSASSDANTLDDYEEGTFTPSFTSGLTSVSYTVQQGRYTKIGRIVYFTIYLNISGGTQVASNVDISLPFTSGTTPSTFAGAAYFAYASAGLINSTSTNLPTMYIGSAATSLNLYNTAGGNFLGTQIAGSTPAIYIVGWMECA